ncbi:BnaAnng21710D [Brassica napus]|uniref:BnaAnng21710D protein n=1 Tax=Brassica napus TaxID=3708 RepID=A0A078JHI9_BRANA|nr:BnaAnng21710D [Brassica napus]
MSVRLSQAPIIDRHVDLTSLSIQSEKAVTTFTDTHFFNKLCFFSGVIMTTSKRLADRKIEKFDKNITKRGFVPETTTKKGKDYPVGPILLGFFVFVVIGSSLFQIIRTATSGGMA